MTEEAAAMHKLALILAGVPALAAAFSMPAAGALSLSMSSSHRDSASALCLSSSSYHLGRREVLAAVPLAAGVVMAPPAAVAEESMQWPFALGPDSIVPVGKGKIPALGFGMPCLHRDRTDMVIIVERMIFVSARAQ